jgi:hypothetical protein
MSARHAFSESSALVAAAYVASYVVNWVGIAVMAGCAAMNRKDLVRWGRGQRKWKPLGFYPTRLVRATERPLFWWAFWMSFAALTVNTFLPLVLLAWLPLGTVLAVFALGAAFNLPAIPFRAWLWRLR